MDRLFLLRIDPRPDDVEVVAYVFFMKLNGAVLVRETQSLLHAMDVLHVLVVAEARLVGVGIDR